MDDSPASPPELQSPPRLTPRRLLGRIFILMILAGLVSWLAPVVLPIRVIEGPIVQFPEPTHATIVWYTSKPGVTKLVTGNGLETPVLSQNRRHSARLAFAPSDESITYRILVGSKQLAEGAVRAPRKRAQPFSFLLFGDSGRATREQYQLAAQMVARCSDCDLIVHTGDVVYPGGDRKDYRERFFVPYAPLLGRLSIWPSLGNHDVSKPHFGEPYREIFELPANGPQGLLLDENYWFDYGDARFVVLNSNLEESVLTERVAPWLRDTLKDSDATWKFAVFHHPPYSVGKHGSNEVMRRALVPALEAGGADMVFNGHDHTYQRTKPIRGGALDENGIVYVVSGAGGAALYEMTPQPQWPDWLAAGTSAKHSFTRVAIDGKNLSLEQFDIDGEKIDAIELRKH
ncbi:MAG: metallophosphoesterase [Phycisphaerales bacterium]|nr:metallophosphoesterase [Phycisphaerales bacterium]